MRLLSFDSFLLINIAIFGQLELDASMIQHYMREKWTTTSTGLSLGLVYNWSNKTAQDQPPNRERRNWTMKIKERGPNWKPHFCTIYSKHEESATSWSQLPKRQFKWYLLADLGTCLVSIAATWRHYRMLAWIPRNYRIYGFDGLSTCLFVMSLEFRLLSFKGKAFSLASDPSPSDAIWSSWMGSILRLACVLDPWLFKG